MPYEEAAQMEQDLAEECSGRVPRSRAGISPSRSRLRQATENTEACLHPSSFVSMPGLILSINTPGRRRAKVGP